MVLQRRPYGPGIGVAEATIQSLFEHSDVGFTFENSSSVKRAPRSIGTSPHGLATIELIGQPENLTQATIRVNIPDDDTQALTLNAEYVLRFIQSVAPQWAGGGDWVIQNLDAFCSWTKDGGHNNSKQPGNFYVFEWRARGVNDNSEG